MYSDRKRQCRVTGTIKQELMIMWTLLKREIEDTWVYLLVVVLIAGGSIAFAEFAQHTATNSDGSGKPILGYVILCLLLLGVGSNRMVVDRTNGISTFFAGHLNTRGQVFTIRIFMGVLLVALFYIPALCWLLWKLSQQAPTLPPNLPTGKLAGMAIFLFLLPLACYSLGLRMGQVNKKIIHNLGSICLGVMLISFAILKGFGFEAVIVLLVLNVSLVYSAWQRYAAAAL
jgi:hypothetical protein